MTTATEESLNLRAVIFVALIALLPLFAIEFGTGNQVEQLPIIARLADPGFAAGDFFLEDAAKPGQPRYYYSLFIATLTAFAPLHLVFHALTYLTSFLLGVVTFLAARKLLGADEVGAAIAAVLAVLNGGFTLGLSGFLTFESYQPASVAVPLSVLGIYLLLSGRAMWASLALGAGCLMHPTLGAEAAALVYGAAGILALWQIRSSGLRPIVPLALSGAIFAAIVVAAWLVPALGADDVPMTSAEFMEILPHFRAPHHYFGLEFPRRRWFEAILFATVAGWLLLKYRDRGVRNSVAGLALVFAGVVALCLLSLWFVDVAESRLWATAQVFRLTFLIKWIGFLVIGRLLAGWVVDRRPSGLLLAMIATVATYDAQPYALWIAVAAWALIGRLGLREALALPVAIVAVGFAAHFQNRFGLEDQSLRVLVGTLGLGLVFLCRAQPIGTFATAVLIVGFMALAYLQREAGLLGRDAFASTYSLDADTSERTQISRIAAEVSPDGAIWLVPPGMEAFRSISRRAAVVDFKSVPFTNRGLREWRDRIEDIYGPVSGRGFLALRQMQAAHLSTPATELAHQKYGADYAILALDTPWEGAILGQTANFKAVRIAP